MTTAKRAKELGLTGLKEVVDELGKYKEFYIRLYDRAPDVFDAICKGVLAKKQAKQILEQD